MAKTVNEIKEKFQDYTELKTKRKTVQSSPIPVKLIKDRHPTFKIGDAKLLHQTIKKNMKMEIEVKIDNTADFKFKLFCSEYFVRPFFRFDSEGPAHRNNSPDIPLKDQMVSPPHFHEFNSEGVEIAYKTKALKSPTQLSKLKDINTCIMHFCKEGNVRYLKKDFPEVVLQAGEFPFKFTNEDPLTNVNF